MLEFRPHRGIVQKGRLSVVEKEDAIRRNTSSSFNACEENLTYVVVKIKLEENNVTLGEPAVRLMPVYISCI